MAKALSLSLDEYPSLAGLLQGQSVELKIVGNVLDTTDRMMTFGVKSISVISRTELSTNEVVQQLAALREKVTSIEARG